MCFSPRLRIRYGPRGWITKLDVSRVNEIITSCLLVSLNSVRSKQQTCPGLLINWMMSCGGRQTTRWGSSTHFHRRSPEGPQKPLKVRPSQFLRIKDNWCSLTTNTVVYHFIQRFEGRFNSASITCQDTCYTFELEVVRLVWLESEFIVVYGNIKNKKTRPWKVN